jgi:hypothetical protein
MEVATLLLNANITYSEREKPKGVSSLECLKNGHGLLYLEIKNNIKL